MTDPVNVPLSPPARIGFELALAAITAAVGKKADETMSDAIPNAFAAAGIDSDTVGQYLPFMTAALAAITEGLLGQLAQARGEADRFLFLPPTDGEKEWVRLVRATPLVPGGSSSGLHRYHLAGIRPPGAENPGFYAMRVTAPLIVYAAHLVSVIDYHMPAPGRIWPAYAQAIRLVHLDGGEPYTIVL